MNRRYQIFISSTYTDLKEERFAVVENILKSRHIPVGMELFVAANETQFNYIKRVIDDSDYYIIIIGNRYGSRDDDGISYTEREFDYAVEKNVPILAFVHSNPDIIPSGKSESSPEAIEKLNNFRNKVTKNRLVSLLGWETPETLVNSVLVALTNAIIDTPRIGWTRASEFDETELLAQINTLRIENTALKQKIDKEKDVLFFQNNLAGAFVHILSDIKHIQKLRIYGITTATIQPKILDFQELTIDECVILLKKLPDNEGLFGELYEKTKEAAVTRWKQLFNNKRIGKLTIIEYDKYPDIWYVICDNNKLLTDIFTLNDNDITYDIQKDKAVIMVSSATDASQGYITRHINQFDNYEKYFRAKKDGVLLEQIQALGNF
jgi:hypothetical protein